MHLFNKAPDDIERQVEKTTGMKENKVKKVLVAVAQEG